MKLNRQLLLSVLFLPSVIFAQQIEQTIQLKNGFVRLEPNIKKAFLDSFSKKATRFHQKTFAVLQFESIPTEETKKLLSASGVELLEYIPNNAYTVSISGSPSVAIFEQAKAERLPFFVINFHDVYFSDAYPDNRNWYIWFIEYLHANKFEFIDFSEAVKFLNIAVAEKTASS